MAMATETPDVNGEYTCQVCRKVFKRAANLIYHMTEHRPQAEPRAGGDELDIGREGGSGKALARSSARTATRSSRPSTRRRSTTCAATSTARSPLRAPSAARRSLSSKEDLTMHMKACGNVYVCRCGIRLCSLGALKRHCKQFSHEPLSLEPTPEASLHSAIDASGLPINADAQAVPAQAAGRRRACPRWVMSMRRWGTRCLPA